MECIFFILAILEFYLVVVGASATRMVGELTHMRSMCVGVAETWVEYRSPAKKHKETFLLFALFTDEKRGKSHIRSFLPYVSSPHLPAMLYSNNHRPPVRT